MNSTDLKTQLAQETQAKNQSVELAKIALLNGAANFQQQLNESAQNYRADLRDEMKKARESWEESARAERRQLEDSTRAERRRWEESSTRATEELERTKRKLWLWGPVALLVTVLVTVGVTIWATTFSVQKATGLAFSELQQSEAMKVAELRSQVETSRGQIAAAKAELQKISDKTEAERQRLAEAEARQSVLTTFPGKEPGTMFVQIRSGAQPFEYQGRTLIQAATQPQAR